MLETISSPVAALLGGMAGALVSLAGILIEHRLNQRSAARRHRREKLELIAELLDETVNLVARFPYDYVSRTRFDIGQAFRLQTLVGMYLPAARSDVTSLIEILKDLASESWSTQMQLGNDPLGPVKDKNVTEHLSKVKDEWAGLLDDVIRHADKVHALIRSEQLP